MKQLLAAGLVSLMAIGSAWGHGIWVAERHGQQALVYGHGASDDAYDPSKLVGIGGFDAKGEAVEIKGRPQNDHILLDVPEATAGILAEFDNGFWSKDKKGKWHNKPKAEVPEAVFGGRYLKYSVSLLRESNYAVQPKGQKLEILPLTDPMTLSQGDTLAVRVLADGKPLSGVAVMADYVNDSHNKSAETNASGEVDVTIRNDGLNVIAVATDIPADDEPNVDEIGLFATLSFNLPHRH